MPSRVSSRTGGRSRSPSFSRTVHSASERSESGVKSRRETSRYEDKEKTYPKTKLEYYRKELKRLEEETQKRKKQIKSPRRKQNEPYVFNSLKPYRDTTALRLAIEQPDDVQHFAVSRNTAGGPCDPWISLELDMNFLSPRPSVATNRYKRQASGSNTARSNARGRDGGASSRSQKSSRSSGRETSPTRAADEDKDGKRTSIYPIVTFYRNEMTGKQLDYSHVPQIRTEVRNTYSTNATKKRDQDYCKTKADFTRRGLGNMEELTDNSRHILSGAYLAYLQNTPGSTKAIQECLTAEDDKGKQSEQKKSEKPDQYRSSRCSKTEESSTAESRTSNVSRASTGSQRDEGNTTMSDKYNKENNSRTSRRQDERQGRKDRRNRNENKEDERNENKTNDKDYIVEE